MQQSASIVDYYRQSRILSNASFLSTTTTNSGCSSNNNSRSSSRKLSINQLNPFDSGIRLITLEQQEKIEKTYNNRKILYLYFSVIGQLMIAVLEIICV